MTYICSVCNGEFESGWTEEEALAELALSFPALLAADAAVACDDCYTKIRNGTLVPVQPGTPAGVTPQAESKECKDKCTTEDRSTSATDE